MVKKIKKYAKFIVCMGLILGLMAPSYAALSASDGSAFVTKAEFDSALADFNARLTTFEAGINSKIDSQVTSYLDRNGIWSGKEQILLCGGDKIYFKGRTFYHRSAVGTTGDLLINKMQTLDCFPYNEKIAVADKGGLCLLQFEQSAPLDAAAENRIYISGETCSRSVSVIFEAGCGDGSYTDSRLDGSSTPFSVTTGTVNTLANNKWNNIWVQMSSMDLEFAAVYTTNLNYSAFFFVDKFQSIWLRAHFILVIGAGMTRFNTANSLFMDGGGDETKRPALRILKCTIY